MTRQQAAVVERLRKAIMDSDGLGAHQVDYEFKRFEVRESADTSLVFLSTEVGRKNDAGTAAEIFCRKVRLIAIGPRGGCRLLNPRRPPGTPPNREIAQPTGFWAAVNERPDGLGG